MSPARLLLLLAGIAAMNPAPALEVTGVRAEPAVFDPRRDEKAAIQFRIDEPAKATLSIYDGRDLLIRSVAADELPAGEHALVWDGKDQAGHPVPPEAYRYTLVAEAPSGERVEHDLTDLTGGEDLAPLDVQWNPDTKRIRYRLSAPARVNIRVGLKDGGPLLRTVRDWVARGAGSHEEYWDGFDVSGVLDLARHPGLDIAVNAFALSGNTLIVGPPSDTVQLIDELPWGETRRTPKQTAKKRMYAHSQQSLEERSDFTIHLSLAGPHGKAPDGVPVVSGSVPVRLEVDPKDRARALARRFEPVFFVDGLFAFENESGFLPMTFQWNAATVNPGVHYITANLRGYEGNFGMATVKVYVETTSAEKQDR